jgi:hypothetical protein
MQATLGVVMGKADHLTTRATQLFALAMKAREDGLLDYAEELASKAQRDLDEAIALIRQPLDKPVQKQQPPNDDFEFGY